MPKPSLLTPERQKQIVDLIGAGNEIEVAAISAGISKSTHYAWVQRGREEQERLNGNPRATLKKSEQPYLEYLEAIERALYQAESRYAVIITKAAAEKDWRAAAWLLTHRPSSRDRWKEVNRTEITGADGGAIKSESKNVNLTEAEVIALADEILGINPPVIKEISQ